MKARILSSFFVLVIASVPLQGWAAETPTNTVKKLVDSVRSYKKENASSSAQDRAANLQAQKVAEETLAIADLAKRVLGPEWAKLSAAQQKDFTELLTTLFQKIAYPKSAEFFGDLQIDYRNEEITGSQATVQTMVSHPQEGQVDIDYRLRLTDGQWMIEDVLLDGVSLITNVRTQMQQVIAKESYQGLVKRMREKLAES